MSASIQLAHPVPGSTPTDPFGWRGAIPGVIGAQLHNGQDFAAPEGTPIHAANPGTITGSWFEDGMGGWMTRVAGPGSATLYAHMQAATYHPIGTLVNAGDVIGYVGQTGAATGPHLHFMLEIGGTYVDPMPYLTTTTPMEEDDMYTDEDRYLAKLTNEAVGRMELKMWTIAQEVNQIHVSVDVNKWALTDARVGLRKQIAGLAQLVADIPTGDLNPDVIVRALGQDDLDAIAKAVADEQAKRLAA